MRKLWSIENTYKVYRENEEIGWIQFVKHVDNKHNEWRILTTSGSLPVSTVHLNAECAKKILDENNLT
jgi:hypothetical protein